MRTRDLPWRRVDEELHQHFDDELRTRAFHNGVVLLRDERG